MALFPNLPMLNGAAELAGVVQREDRDTEVAQIVRQTCSTKT